MKEQNQLDHKLSAQNKNKVSEEGLRLKDTVQKLQEAKLIKNRPNGREMLGEIEPEVLNTVAFTNKTCIFIFCHKSLEMSVPVQRTSLLTVPQLEVLLF